jgi:hypothetical protein
VLSHRQAAIIRFVTSRLAVGWRLWPVWVLGGSGVCFSSIFWCFGESPVPFCKPIEDSWFSVELLGYLWCRSDHGRRMSIDLWSLSRYNSLSSDQWSATIEFGAIGAQGHWDEPTSREQDSRWRNRRNIWNPWIGRVFWQFDESHLKLAIRSQWDRHDLNSPRGSQPYRYDLNLPI